MKEEGGGHLHLQFTIYYLRLRVEILRSFDVAQDRCAQNDRGISILQLAIYDFDLSLRLN